ncbi:vitelline membrane protein Vm26Aa-like [Eupeodes corollae]|uniref:vitelline membrane protein Vm26Aa-like n=1 Tax=Eupeodes corollae TaxID=290404 RepID=UPI00248FA5B9|nr:vitelline membrane protein Vm26Aa-like [Eupeodes corollae]
MQSFICFISIAAALIAVTSSASVAGYLNEPVPENILESLVAASQLKAPEELVRWKKSAYGGAQLQAPPCPKNYLFSCQSSVAPVPCAAPPAPAPAKPSYAGAYSMQVPRYTYPQEAYNQGIPQELLMPSIYGYNQQYLY